MQIPGFTFTDSVLVTVVKALEYVFSDADWVRINFENHGLGILVTLQHAEHSRVLQKSDDHLKFEA